MTQLLVTIPFCVKDADLTLKLLRHIQWLIGKTGNRKLPALLLAADANVDKDKVRLMADVGRECFQFVSSMLVRVPVTNQGWPMGANYMFMEVSKQVSECYKWPWLWLEPDAVPLKESWYNQLEHGYFESPRPFMGHVLPSSTPNTPKHTMSGVAVYPQDAYQRLKPFLAGSMAFDMQMADYVTRRCLNTPLIHHHFGTLESPPVFRDKHLPADLPYIVTPAFINKEAVIFHRSKDGALIDILEGKWNSTRMEETKSPVPTEPPKRKPGRPPKIQQAATATP